MLEVSVRANMRVVEELRGDENMCQALLEIMEPEINEMAESKVNMRANEIRNPEAQINI